MGRRPLQRYRSLGGFGTSTNAAVGTYWDTPGVSKVGNPNTAYEASPRHRRRRRRRLRGRGGAPGLAVRAETLLVFFAVLLVLQCLPVMKAAYGIASGLVGRDG